HAPNKAACLVQDLETDAAYPTREDKARRFVELLGEARGASRASYFRLLSFLEKQGRLAVIDVPSITLWRRRPPGVPSLLELDAMAAPLPGEPEEEPRAVDLPAREGLARPISGQAPAQPSRARIVLDDSLPWEARHTDDEGE